MPLAAVIAQGGIMPSANALQGENNIMQCREPGGYHAARRTGPAAGVHGAGGGHAAHQAAAGALWHPDAAAEPARAQRAGPRRAGAAMAHLHRKECYVCSCILLQRSVAAARALVSG